jgi:hypothetical protein
MRRLILALAAAVAALVLPPAGRAAAAPVAGAAQKVTPTLAGVGQRQARVAAGPDGFLVVWAEGVGGGSRVRGARVGTDGVSLDPGGLTLAVAAGGQFEPAVASGHGIYYVVWSDLRAGDHVVYGARVAATGEVLDPGGVPLSSEPTAARMADVAATPDGFLVAWAQAEPSGRGFAARALRLGTGGLPLDPAPLKVTDPAPWTAGEDFGHAALADAICQHVRVAVQGTTALVVWGGTAGRQQGYFIVRALLDVASGATAVAADNAVEGAQSRIYNPAACDYSDGFLFSWTDFRERGGVGLPDDNAGLMTTAAAVSYAPLQETHTARIVWEPAVATNGVVAFVSPYENPQRDRRMESHLILRQLLPDGTSPGADVQVEVEAAWPALATHAGGATLLVYTVVGTPADNGMLRARVVTIE